MTASNTTAAPRLDTDAVAAAARAAADLLPSSRPLTAGTPRPGVLAAPTASAGAVTARLDGPGNGAVAVLVGPELVAALAVSPLGELDLAAAVQPALDAAAGALGVTARAGETINPSLVEGAVGEPVVAVPLLHGDETDAVLLITPPAAAITPVAPTAAGRPSTRPGIELLHGVVMEVTVELGRTRLPVRDLLALSPGAVLELDRAAGSPADLLVNGRLIARGEVVVVDEDFGLRVTEIVTNAAAS